MSLLALETKGLKKAFGELVAVDGLDLVVPRGSFYGFLGQNGAGKIHDDQMSDRLAQADVGLVPDSRHGSVRRSGGCEKENRCRAGRSRAVRVRLTGAETLTFVGQVYGLDSASLRKRSRELLEIMDLAGMSRELVADYSHGMRKKIALAAALLPAPRLLFLDEPFEGIDAVASRQVKGLLLEFVHNGGTVFLTSHILEIVERLCDHIGIIRKGRLVAQGPLADLRAKAGTDQSLEDLFLSIHRGGRVADGQARLAGRMRALWAFTWIRWRMLVNSLTSAQRRDAVERVSRVAALAIPMLFLAAALSSVLAGLVMGGYTGWFSVSHPMDAVAMLTGIRVVLVLATVFAVLMPVFVGVHGGAGRVGRLLLLPIPRNALHAVEVISGLTDPWIVFVTPAFVAYAVGMIAAGYSRPIRFFGASSAADWSRWPLPEAWRSCSGRSDPWRRSWSAGWFATAGAARCSCSCSSSGSPA